MIFAFLNLNFSKQYETWILNFLSMCRSCLTSKFDWVLILKKAFRIFTWFALEVMRSCNEINNVVQVTNFLSPASCVLLQTPSLPNPSPHGFSEHPCCMATSRNYFWELPLHLARSWSSVTLISLSLLSKWLWCPGFYWSAFTFHWDAPENVSCLGNRNEFLPPRLSVW